MELAHTKTVEEILAEFKVAEEEGLDNAHVEEQRRKHGLNGKSKGKCHSYKGTCFLHPYPAVNELIPVKIEL